MPKMEKYVAGIWGKVSFRRFLSVYAASVDDAAFEIEEQLDRLGRRHYFMDWKRGGRWIYRVNGSGALITPAVSGE